MPTNCPQFSISVFGRPDFHRNSPPFKEWLLAPHPDSHGRGAIRNVISAYPGALLLGPQMILTFA